MTADITEKLKEDSAPQQKQAPKEMQKQDANNAAMKHASNKELQHKTQAVELEQRLTIAEKTVIELKAELTDKALRAQAEIDNIRRRSSQDLEKAHRFALDSFISEILPVIDSMEMSLSHADYDDQRLKPMIEGIELTLQQLFSVIEKFGVERIAPKNDFFDPSKHQAISVEESKEIDINKVLNVIQNGYALNGRLLRPALVTVVQNKDKDKDIPESK